MENFNIATIDGGGIKGLRSLFVLREIERITGKLSHELYDLLSGTSTGGIIAVMLAMGYSAQDVIDLYTKHGDKIFEKKFLRFGWIRPKYDDNYLNSVIREYVGDKKLFDVKTNLIVPTYNTDTRDKVLFKSFGKLGDTDMFDVVRSTVSAQSYFKPHKINGQSHIDGGVVINNPSMVSYVEYLKRWNDKPMNMLSIGTGRDEKKIKISQGGGGMFQWASPTVDILLIEQSQQTDYFMEHINPEDYIRIDPLAIAGDSDMDNASKENIQKLQSDGEATVEKYNNLINAFVTKLQK